MTGSPQPVSAQQRQDGVIFSLLIIIIETLLSKGVKQAGAVLIGKEIIKNMCQGLGGNVLYVPKGQAEKHAETVATIYAEYDGTNIQQLATKYGFSSVHIYAVINAARRAEVMGNKRPELSKIKALLQSKTEKGV